MRSKPSFFQVQLEGESVSIPIKYTRRRGSIGVKSWHDVAQNSNVVCLYLPDSMSVSRVKRELKAFEPQIKKLLQRLQNRDSATSKSNAHANACHFPNITKTQTFRWLDVLWEIRFSSKVKRPVWDESLKILFVPEKMRHQPKSMVKVFVDHAAAFFEANLPKLAQKVGVHYRAIEVKTYKTRWGSCRHDQRIQFNWKLMQAPLSVVEYVMVHELCHIIEMNHSQNYWQLVARHDPKFQESKRYLKVYGQQMMSCI